MVMFTFNYVMHPELPKISYVAIETTPTLNCGKFSEYHLYQC